MQTTIQKWGNSQAVRLPKRMLESLMLKENDSVEIRAESDSIIITKATRKRRAKTSLAERFSEWDNKPYEPTEDEKAWLSIEPVGKEVRL